MNTGPRGGCTFLFAAFMVIVVGCMVPIVVASYVAVQAFVLMATPASSADLPLARFGTYSDAHLRKRWANLCKGGGRYQAMAEAYELGRPDPCQVRY